MSGGARTNTRRDHLLREEFFAEGQRLSRDSETEAKSRCWLCGESIDYDAPANSTPESHNLDHFKPVRDYPELQQDPTNFRHAHALCNSQRGAKAPSLGLGDQIADWW